MTRAAIYARYSSDRQGTKNRRWSLASNSRSMRDSPRIVGVETRNTLRLCAKVSERASANFHA
jgi:hypothetical protein